MQTRIVLTGGGTGGHIIPLLAVAKKIKESARLDSARLAKDREVSFYFLGNRGRFGEDFFSKEGISTINIQSGKLRRYFSPANILDLFKIPVGFFQSLWFLLKIMPDAVFSKGGYASFPVIVVAWLYRIPVIIHESDAVAGWANRIAANFSNRAAVGFESAARYFKAQKAFFSGNPVREGIGSGNAQRAREAFKLSESKPVIFVCGGSQGAWQINREIVNILPRLLHNYQIIHQTGEETYQKTTDLANEMGIKEGREGYCPVKFLDEDLLEDVLALSDIIVARAGASSIAEFAAAGKPVILIPLGNAANNHQRMNAFELAKVQAALVLEESGGNMLFDKINELGQSAELKEKLSKNIKSFYNPEAAEKIALELLEMTK